MVWNFFFVIIITELAAIAATLICINDTFRNKF